MPRRHVLHFIIPLQTNNFVNGTVIRSNVRVLEQLKGARRKQLNDTFLWANFSRSMNLDPFCDALDISTVASNSYILILVRQKKLPSWSWWLWQSMTAPGCFCPGMLAGYRCCCGVYQRAAGSNVFHCGSCFGFSIVAHHSCHESWYRISAPRALVQGDLIWVKLISCPTIYTANQAIEVISWQKCLKDGQVLRGLVGTPCTRLEHLEMSWNVWIFTKTTKLLLLSLTEGVQEILLDLGGGCFGMDSFRGKNGRVPCKVLNWCRKSFAAEFRSGCRMYQNALTSYIYVYILHYTSVIWHIYIYTYYIVMYIYICIRYACVCIYVRVCMNYPSEPQWHDLVKR